MTNMLPVPVSYHDLADLLMNLSHRVREGDSLEGFIEYGIGDEPDQALVRATYRVGNLQGQGGMRMIGNFPEDRPMPKEPT